jgi:hypothetical protein
MKDEFAWMVADFCLDVLAGGEKDLVALALQVPHPLVGLRLGVQRTDHQDDEFMLPVLALYPLLLHL